MQIYQGQEKVILISVLHYDNLCRSGECVSANVDRTVLLPETSEYVCLAVRFNECCRPESERLNS